MLRDGAYRFMQEEETAYQTMVEASQKKRLMKWACAGLAAVLLVVVAVILLRRGPHAAA